MVYCTECGKEISDFEFIEFNEKCIMCHRNKFIKNPKSFFSQEGVRIFIELTLSISLMRIVGEASLCIQCGECLEKCPQQIDIPDILKKAKEIFEEGKKISEVFP